MKTFKIGGIHPDAAKLTAEQPIHIIDDPDVLTLMLGQSIGKPAKAVVKAGDIVAQGQLIAEADGVMSAEEYEPVRQQREEWRDKINALETELAAATQEVDAEMAKVVATQVKEG